MIPKIVLFKKYLLVLFCLTLILLTVNAELLVTTYTEKTEIYPNEIDFLVVKVLNNSNIVLDKAYLRIEGSEDIIFVDSDGEKEILLTGLVDLAPGVTKELKFKFKSLEVNKDPSALFVYYGFEKDYSKGILPFVSGTIVSTKDSKVTITTKVDKSQTSAGGEIIGEVVVSNKSGKVISKFGSEMIVPDNFDLKSEPFFTEEIIDSNNVSIKFNALAPINVDGEQRILLVYGYFDENGAHYFEKEHKVSFVKTNRSILALVGIIVLIIAVFLYLKSTKKDDKLKGSGDKK